MVTAFAKISLGISSIEAGETGQQAEEIVELDQSRVGRLSHSAYVVPRRLNRRCKPALFRGLNLHFFARKKN
jgi:hypothetical protein